MSKTKQSEESIENNLLNGVKAFLGSHFMLNVLNSIQSDILLDKKKEAFSSLQLYSRLLKSALKAGNGTLHEIESEVALLNDYLALENMRFGKGKISTRVETKIKSSGILVPTFIFQSLIENAILLSLEDKDNHVKVSLSADENQVELKIKLKKNHKETIHKKVEGKTTLALERMQMLEDSNIFKSSLRFGNGSFTTLILTF